MLAAMAKRYTSAYPDVIRAKIILYAAVGLTNEQTARRLDTPRQRVSKWRKRFFEQGFDALQELPRRGHPARFSPSRDRGDQGPGVRASSSTGHSTLAIQHCGDQAGSPSPGSGGLHRGYRLACGVGSPRMPIGSGAIGVGSFRRIPISRRRPGGCWTSTKASGKAFLCRQRIVSSVPTRRPAYRPVGASTPPCHLHRPSPNRVEHEYECKGAWVYLAAWDVRRANIHGRCEPATGIAPFERLVSQAMSRVPYRSAPQVFWILDNGSAHRGQRCVGRLKTRWPTIIVVHTPIHASWPNQVRIYLSVVQRKVSTPNDFASLAALQDRLLRFSDSRNITSRLQSHSNGYCRQDLAKLMSKLRADDSPPPKAA